MLSPPIFQSLVKRSNNSSGLSEVSKEKPSLDLEELAFSYIDPKRYKVRHLPAQIADKVFLNPIMENNMAGKKTNISKIRKGSYSFAQLLYLLWASRQTSKDSNLSRIPAFPEPCAKSCRRWKPSVKKVLTWVLKSSSVFLQPLH